MPKDLQRIPFDAGAAAAEAPFDLRFRPARGAAEPPAWVALPRRPRAGARPLVLVHGISRDAEGMARRMAPRAAAAGRALIAPLFTEQAFPAYQRAACRRRADRAMLALLDSLAAEGAIAPGPADFAGYSGGAQFSHRFAWLYPHRAGRLTLAAAGWWTFPDAAPFPYGLGPAARGPADAPRWLRANLRAFLDRRITVAVGALDDAPDASTRSEPELDARQGRDRLTRARRWTRAMREEAARLGLEDRIAFAVLPDCGHDFHACAEAGLDRLILP